MSAPGTVATKEEIGVCTCHSGHVDLDLLRNTRAPVGDSEEAEAQRGRQTERLLRLSNVVEHVDCARFLLWAKIAVRHPRDGYCHCWPTYGRLLGEIIKRDSAMAGALHASDFWAELYDDFGKAGAGRWEVRRGIFDCFAGLVNSCCDHISAAQSDHFQEFWGALSDFQAHLEVAHAEGMPDPSGELVWLTEAFVDMWYRLTEKLVKQAEEGSAEQELDGVLSPEIQTRLIRPALAALQMFSKPGLVSSPKVWEWGMALGRLVEHVGRPRRRDVQEALNEIARQLKAKADETGGALEKINRRLQGRLCGRSYDGGRKQMVRQHRECELSLAGTTQPVLASIVDVCPATYRGFYLRVPGLLPAPGSTEYQERPVGEVDGFVCKEITVGLPEGGGIARITEVTLQASYGRGGRKKLRLERCSVMRAEPLKRPVGTGLVLLAPESVVESLGEGFEDWKQYVDGRPSK